jgi:hypothetical protein
VKSGIQPYLALVHLGNDGLREVLHVHAALLALLAQAPVL